MIAFVIIVLAIACLAIGWLITGKTKIERGACGRDPTKKRDASCETDTSCDLCEHSSENSSSSQLKKTNLEKTDNDADREEGDKHYK
jgi:hypothetical protein